MLKFSPPVQEFWGLNVQTALFALPGNEEIPSSSVHMCVLKKSLGEEMVVVMCAFVWAATLPL